MIVSKKVKLNTKSLVKKIENKTVPQIRKLICGELIGLGLYRNVYVLKDNPAYVVKIENDMRHCVFANATEWMNYINNKEFKFLEEWLAPCEMISQTGQVLIQQRVYRDGKKKKDYPKHVPTMLTDLKYENFGWIGARFCCCDYSFMLTVTAAVGSKKFKRANWWSNT